MDSGIVVARFLDEISVYADITSQQDSDVQICLPGIICDLEELLIGEVFGFGNYRHLGG